jgi:hypothetical protein
MLIRLPPFPLPCTSPGSTIGPGGGDHCFGAFPDGSRRLSRRTDDLAGGTGRENQPFGRGGRRDDLNARGVSFAVLNSGV